MSKKNTPVVATTATNTTPPDFVVKGSNDAALFSLKIYRGEGMALLAMNWKGGMQPPPDFVGFSIEYQEPKGQKFFPITNRLSFLDNKGNVNPNILSSRLSPIQKFRWVHFPFHADKEGFYKYRVTPVFMNGVGQLSYGDFQEASIELHAETYPGELNVAFTRGFISSQAVWDINAGGRLIGTSPGNPYSIARKITLGDTAETFILVCGKAIETPVFVKQKM